MKLLKQIRFLLILSNILLLSLSTFIIISTRILKENKEILSIQHSDIQRSIGSFDFSTRSLITEYNADQISLYRIKYETIDKPQTISNISMSLVNVLTKHDIQQSSLANQNTPLLSTVPISVYMQVMPSMLQHKPVFYIVKNLDPGPLRETLEAKGTYAALWIDISNAQDQVVGIIGVSWEQPDLIPTDERYTAMIEYLRQVSFTISRTFMVQMHH